MPSATRTPNLFVLGDDEPVGDCAEESLYNYETVYGVGVGPAFILADMVVNRGADVLQNADLENTLQRNLCRRRPAGSRRTGVFLRRTIFRADIGIYERVNG